MALALPPMKWAVVAFPGTNCEEDTRVVLADILAQDVRVIWHQETDLGAVDAVVLPGGFAHGDALRCGAIARFSPIMEAVLEHAARGGRVLGICNGMQVLAEAGLLPGALLRNASLEFRCRWVHSRVEAEDGSWLGDAHVGDVLYMPISHGEGRYHCEPEQLAALSAAGQVLLRYCDAAGKVTEDSNPNGSVSNVAGIRNRAGNVLGLMPHPERASAALLGGTDGLKILRAMIKGEAW